MGQHKVNDGRHAAVFGDALETQRHILIIQRLLAVLYRCPIIRLAGLVRTPQLLC